MAYLTAMTADRTDRRGFIPCPPALSPLTHVTVSADPGMHAKPEFRDGHLTGVRVYRSRGDLVRLRRARVSWMGETADGA